MELYLQLCHNQSRKSSAEQIVHFCSQDSVRWGRSFV